MSRRSYKKETCSKRSKGRHKDVLNFKKCEFRTLIEVVARLTGHSGPSLASVRGEA